MEIYLKKNRSQNAIIGNNGFTLLEVLVSITILSLIIVVIYSAFMLGNKAWKRGERDIDVNQRFRIGLEILTRDISSAYRYRTRVSNNWIVLFIGKPERLMFISSLSTGLMREQEMGLHQVEYYLNQGSSDLGKGLLRKEFPITNSTPFDDEISEEKLILPWVTDIKFEYLYRKLNRKREKLSDTEEEWEDYWGGVSGDSIDDLRLAIQPGMDPEISRASRNFLPTAVRVTLTFERSDDKKEAIPQDLPPIVIPILSHGTYR